MKDVNKNKKLQPQNSDLAFSKKCNNINNVLNELIRTKKAEIRDKSLNTALNQKICEFRKLMQHVH